MSPELTFAGRQNRGIRTNQEDCYGFCLLDPESPEPILILALADGMGGHQRGEVASEIAVSTFIRALDVRTSDRRRALIDALLEANTQIAEENSRVGGGPDEMGTTFVGLCLQAGRLQWVSVGDSPLYLFRGKDLVRLNEDHATTPTPQEDGSPPLPGALLAALTGRDIRMLDAPTEPLLLQDGDIILCASDGLHSIAKDRISSRLEVYSAMPADSLAEALITAVEAERKAYQDNITVAVVKHVLHRSPNFI